jgi:hypothetical protein
MRRFIACVAVASGLLAACGGGSGRETFRESYERHYTGGDAFAEKPPTMTDAQVDEAIRRVCAGGRSHGLDEADDIAQSMLGGIPGSSQLGSAIAFAAVDAGCRRD